MDTLEKLSVMRDSKAPVRGVVDAERAAHLLGVPTKRFTVWQSKRTKVLRDGGVPTGVLSLIPDPIGYLNGGAVWGLREIERIKDLIADSAGSVGRPRRKPQPESQAS